MAALSSDASKFPRKMEEMRRKDRSADDVCVKDGDEEPQEDVMVHSGSATLMKATPSTSPHLTIPVTATPLQPSSGGPTDQDRTPISTKVLKNTTIVTPARKSALPDCASAHSSAKTPDPARGLVNGRTSGRKRTPKACDCCGFNSAGYNAKPADRGRGRGHGRGRGRDLLGETPKRKSGQHAKIKQLNLTNQSLNEAEGDEAYEKMQTSGPDAQSQTSVTLPVPSQDGLICAVPVKRRGRKRKDRPAESPAGGELQDLEKKFSETPGGGVSAKGCHGQKASDKPNIEGKSKIAERGVVAILKSNGSALTKSAGNQDAEKVQQKVKTDQRSVKCSFGNRETVNLSDSEEELQDNTIIELEQGNGTLDSSMEVKHTADRAEQVPLVVTLSNGKDHNRMEVETLLPAQDSSQPHWSISMSSTQNHLALRDHRLYCVSGTWERIESEEAEMDGKMQDEDSEEELMGLIHDFLESFYLKYGSFSPLTEMDVVDHLKTKGDGDLSDKLDIKGEIKRYTAGLASAPVAGFMVAYNKHTLSLEDLGTLEEQNWLNDQIINMYGELIMEATEHKVHFFNSFFYKQLVTKGYEGVKRWTKKIDLFAKWLLLIPIHLEIHWSLVTVSMATKTINYYDSQGIVFRHTTDNIMRYLQSEAREKKLSAFQKGWKIIIHKGIPQQKNDSDCGVFVLEYCRRLSLKQLLLFSQEDMPPIRKRIYKELCDFHLND